MLRFDIIAAAAVPGIWGPAALLVRLRPLSPTALLIEGPRDVDTRVPPRLALEPAAMAGAAELIRAPADSGSAAGTGGDGGGT